jgi:tRNA threonylcarbamoyladenosine biosynthesis protein TsaE
VTRAELRVPDADAMAALGARLAPHLGAGDLVLLHGELGAGKTTFTRGLGAALRVRGAVTSPTFVLARTHPREAGVDGPPLVHVDAYRLSSAAELDDLDLDWAGSIAVVEWGRGLVEGLADAWLDVEIARPVGADAGPDAHPVGAPLDLEADEPRTVTVSAHGGRWEPVVAALAD